ncbi:hypothetical protein BVX95_01935 [archaeon D22]|nr:hypothetical protein BVX95_01935 [archaeon D22]
MYTPLPVEVRESLETIVKEADLSHAFEQKLPKTEITLQYEVVKNENEQNLYKTSVSYGQVSREFYFYGPISKPMKSKKNIQEDLDLFTDSIRTDVRKERKIGFRKYKVNKFIPASFTGNYDKIDMHILLLKFSLAVMRKLREYKQDGRPIFYTKNKTVIETLGNISLGDKYDNHHIFT